MYKFDGKWFKNYYQSYQLCKNLKTINHINNKTDTKHLLQSHIGKLLWMCSQTKPDIAFDICQLGTNLKNSGEQDAKYPNKVIMHLKQNPAQIIYKQPGKDQNLKLLVYADVSHGNLPDGGSQLGYLIFSVAENKKFPILNWQSKRIKCVVRSSLATETLALCVNFGISV